MEFWNYTALWFYRTRLYLFLVQTAFIWQWLSRLKILETWMHLCVDLSTLVKQHKTCLNVGMHRFQELASSLLEMHKMM